MVVCLAGLFRPPVLIGISSPRRSRRVVDAGQHEMDAGSLAQQALCPDRSVVLVDDLLADRQPQPHAHVACREALVGLREGDERMAQLLWRHAWPIIADHTFNRRDTLFPRQWGDLDAHRAALTSPP